MIRDYVRILGARVIEAPLGEFAPVLTREMAAWVADASLAIGRILGGGKVDPRVYANAQRVIVALPRFSAHNLVLPNGAQFATFSFRQMAGELCLSPTSTEPVRRATRLLGLSTTSADGGEYLEACALLRSGLGGTPLVRRLYISDSPRLASAWELVGIRPIPCADVEDSKATVAARETAATDAETVAANPHTVAGGVEAVAASPESGAPHWDEDVATVNVDRTDVIALGPAPICTHPGGKMVGTSNGVARLNDEMSHQGATSYAKTQTSLSSRAPLGAGLDGYDRVVRLFSYGVGKKDEETRRAYRRCVALGYGSESLTEGITAYLSCTPRDRQVRYPLIFLSDMTLVRTWCKRSPRELSPKLLRQDADGFWLYPFSSGTSTGYVECRRNVSRAEAYEAVERMVGEGRRAP